MKRLFSVLLSAVMLSSVITSNVYASESNVQPIEVQQEATIEAQYEDNIIRIELLDEYELKFLDNGVVSITDKNTETTEVLPTEGYDANGTPCIIKYQEVDGVLEISFIPAKGTRAWGWWDGTKCVLGTLGSAGGGAIGGASVGTITIPGVGTISGTILGALSGGAVGIASFC